MRPPSRPVQRTHSSLPPPLRHSLEPFEPAIKARCAPLSSLCTAKSRLTTVESPRRTAKFNSWVQTLNAHEGGLERFSKGYESYGLHAQPNGDVKYREWAPNATTACLIGDFSSFPPTRVVTEDGC